MPKGRKEGNPGNKGGSRKSAYEERKDADWLYNVWHNIQNLQKLTMKIQSGMFSVKDMVLFKAMSGNDAILNNLANKALPDKLDFTSGGKPIKTVQDWVYAAYAARDVRGNSEQNAE